VWEKEMVGNKSMMAIKESLVSEAQAIVPNVPQFSARGHPYSSAKSFQDWFKDWIGS